MIVLFDGVSDALESGRRMIKLTCNLDPELWMTCDCVIINGDSAVGGDELAAAGQHQRIDLKRTRLDAVRSVEQFSNRLIQLLRIVSGKCARRDGFIDCRIQWTAIHIARNSS